MQTCNLSCTNFLIVDLVFERNFSSITQSNDNKLFFFIITYFLIFFKFIDPPTVKIETSQMDNLEDEKDSVTLRCIVDSNPRAAILWKKEGLNGEFSPEQEIVFSPVTRHTAGQYSCTAENQLGMSKADYVEVDVKCKFSNFFHVGL